MTTRQAILNATSSLVLEHGAAATTISKIARAVGITDGAIYRHFKGKQEILTTVYLDILKDMSQGVEEAISDEDDVETRFFACWMQMFRVFLASPERLPIFEHLSRSHLVKDEVKSDLLSQNRRALKAIFTEAKSLGKIREDVDSQVIGIAIYGSVSALFHAAAVQGYGVDEFDESAIQSILETFWKGLS